MASFCEDGDIHIHVYQSFNLFLIYVNIHHGGEWGNKGRVQKIFELEGLPLTGKARGTPTGI